MRTTPRRPRCPLVRRACPPRPGALSALAALTILISACASDGREMRAPRPGQDASIITTTVPDGGSGIEDIPGDIVETTAPPDTDTPTTTAADAFDVVAPWDDGGTIDIRYTCDGLGVSPELHWFNVPDDAVEVAIVMLDDDAVSTGDGGFIHWVVAGIDPEITQVGEGEIPTGAYEGTNGFGSTSSPQIGYGAPCPPPGGGAHTYRIEIHALDQQIELGEGAVGADLLEAIQFASLESTAVTGEYGR